MWHIFSDGFGGFYAYKEPGLDLEGGPIIIALLILSIVCLAGPVVSSPADFAVSFACILVGVLLMLLAQGTGLVPLKPLSFPFFVYAEITYCAGLCADSGDWGLFVAIFMLMFLTVMCIPLTMPIFGDLDADLELGLILTFPINLCVAIASFTYTSAPLGAISWDNTSFLDFYVMRVAVIVTVIAAVVWAVKAARGSTGARVSASTVRRGLLAAALGIAPLLATAFLGALPVSDAGALLLVVLCLAAYALTAAVGATCIGRDFLGMMLVPLFLVGFCYFLASGWETVPCEFSDVLFGLFDNDLTYSVASFVAGGVGFVGQALRMVLTLVADFIDMVFDTPLSGEAATIEVAPVVSYLLLVGLAGWGADLGVNRLSRHLGGKKAK